MIQTLPVSKNGAFKSKASAMEQVPAFLQLAGSFSLDDLHNQTPKITQAVFNLYYKKLLDRAPEYLANQSASLEPMEIASETLLQVLENCDQYTNFGELDQAIDKKFGELLKTARTSVWAKKSGLSKESSMDKPISDESFSLHNIIYDRTSLSPLEQLLEKEGKKERKKEESVAAVHKRKEMDDQKQVIARTAEAVLNPRYLEVFKLHFQGNASLKETSEKLGQSISSLKSVVKRTKNNIKRHIKEPTWIPKNSYNLPGTPQGCASAAEAVLNPRYLEVFKLYYQDKVSQKETGEKFGYSLRSIRRVLKTIKNYIQHRLNDPTWTPRKPGVSWGNLQDHVNVCSDYKEGVSIQLITDKYGFSSTILYKIINASNEVIERRQTNIGTNVKLPDKQKIVLNAAQAILTAEQMEIFQLHYQDKKSIEEIKDSLKTDKDIKSILYRIKKSVKRKLSEPEWAGPKHINFRSKEQITRDNPEICKDFGAGETLETIFKKYNITKDNLYYIIKASKKEKDLRQSRHEAKCKNLAPAAVSALAPALLSEVHYKIFALRSQEKKSYKDIITELNISENSYWYSLKKIKKYLHRKNGTPTSGPGSKYTPVRPVAQRKQDNAVMCHEYRRGADAELLAQSYGVSRRYLKRIIKNSGEAEQIYANRKAVKKFSAELKQLCLKAKIETNNLVSPKRYKEQTFSGVPKPAERSGIEAVYSDMAKVAEQLKHGQTNNKIQPTVRMAFEELAQDVMQRFGPGRDKAVWSQLQENIAAPAPCLAL